MTHDPELDAEMDDLVRQLEQRGLIEIYVNEEGKEAYRLTEQGARVGRQLAMAGDEDQDALMAALLEGEA